MTGTCKKKKVLKNGNNLFNTDYETTKLQLVVHVKGIITEDHSVVKNVIMLKIIKVYEACEHPRTK